MECKTVPFVLLLPETQTFWTQIRFGRRSHVKTVLAPVIISGSLHHKQCDSLCEVRVNTKWHRESHHWCVVPHRHFSSWAPVSVCATRYWRQEGSVHCVFGGCCVCGSGPLWTSPSSSELLAESRLSGALALDHALYSLSGHRCGSSQTSSKYASSSVAATLHKGLLLSLSIISFDIWFGFSRGAILCTGSKTCSFCMAVQCVLCL